MIIKVTADDWRSLDYRNKVLREARKHAAESRRRIYIKVQNRFYLKLVATIDGRFYHGRLHNVG